MNNTEDFFKEFIESKRYKKLQSVNKVLLNTTGIFGISTELPHIIQFLQNHSQDAWLTVDTNVTMKDKRSEYLINQQYTIKIGEVLNYYDLWCRDKKIQNILT